MVRYFSLVFLTLNLIALTLRAQGSSQNCLRCHGMPNLAYQDSLTNGLVRLHVDAQRFKHSQHGRLFCLDCHTSKFKQFPHPQSALKEQLYCTNCHKEERFLPLNFKEKELEFQHSVHKQKLGDKFSCFSCHDPHTFQRMQGSRISDKIAYDNQVCLTCHQQETRQGFDHSRAYRDIQAIHDWLPNLPLHLKNVRCLDCHTPTQNPSVDPHNILSASQAVKKCETCHYKNSSLMARLYRFNAQQEREKKGFLNAVMVNAPYVVGMTRHPLIDQLSVLIFLLMLLGLAAHGFGRWLAHRRQEQ